MCAVCDLFLFRLFLLQTSTFSHTIYLCGLRLYIFALVIFYLLFLLVLPNIFQSQMTRLVNMLSRIDGNYRVITMISSW